MGMKIWWQDILPDAEQMTKDFGFGDQALQDDAYGRLMGVVKAVARPDTEVEVHHVRHSAYALQASYLEMLNNVWLIDGIIEAEKKGYDAAIIGCGNDPGLPQARQAVDIPVVGPTEAAMLLACTLGHKFGVITVAPEFVPLCERNILSYGLDRRAVFPVRVYDLGDNPFQGLLEMIMSPEIVNPQFEELARACVADGAEVVIPACCSLSPATSLLGYKEVPKTGVPIVDVTQAAVKLAEIMVDLKRTIGLGKSQRSWYRSIRPEIRDRMRTMAKGTENEKRES